MIASDELEDQESDPLPVRRETGPLMFLSLFLLLLAFFILLNSISTLRETKSRDVLSSVAATFQSDADPDTTAEILVSTLGPVLEPEEVLDEVERLWLSEVPFVQLDRVTNGRYMAVELPTIQLFVGAEARIRGDRRDLVNATAHVLSNRLPNQVVIMQAILFVDDLADVGISYQAGAVDAANPNQTVDVADPDAQFVAVPDVDGSELSFSRVGVLARALIDGGTPAENFEIGVREGNPSRVRFRFYVRDIDAVRMTLSESDEPRPASQAAGDGS